MGGGFVTPFAVQSPASGRRRRAPSARLFVRRACVFPHSAQVPRQRHPLSLTFTVECVALHCPWILLQDPRSSGGQTRSLCIKHISSCASSTSPPPSPSHPLAILLLRTGSTPGHPIPLQCVSAHSRRSDGGVRDKNPLVCNWLLGASADIYQEACISAIE